MDRRDPRPWGWWAAVRRDQKAPVLIVRDDEQALRPALRIGDQVAVDLEDELLAARYSRRRVIIFRGLRVRGVGVARLDEDDLREFLIAQVLVVQAELVVGAEALPKRYVPHQFGMLAANGSPS